jgi:hypothetical protein
MPCRDDYTADDYRVRTSNLQKKHDQLTRFLCTVLHTLEEENELGHFAELFNYKEGGITREELFAWWKEHKEEDARRKDAERKAREIQERRAAALAKLSKEERKLLGVK